MDMEYNTTRPTFCVAIEISATYKRKIQLEVCPLVVSHNLFLTGSSTECCLFGALRKKANVKAGIRGTDVL